MYAPPARVLKKDPQGGLYIGESETPQAPTSPGNAGPQLAPPGSRKTPSPKTTQSASVPTEPTAPTPAETKPAGEEDSEVPQVELTPNDIYFNKLVDEANADKKDFDKAEALQEFEAHAYGTPVVPLDDRITETHEALRPTHRVVTSAIINALLFVPEKITEGIAFALEGVSWLLGEAVAGIVNFFVMLFCLMLGKDIIDTCGDVRKAIKGGAAALTGAIEGAVRVPVAAVGTALAFTEDLFSFEWTKSWRGALSMLLQPVVQSVFVAVQPLYYGLKNMDDELHPSRPVNERERAWLAKDYDQALINKLRIHDGNASWLMKVTGHWADAQTQGNDVYIRHAGRLTFRHEVVHTLQYNDYGGERAIFYGRYLSDIIAGLALTQSTDEAYKHNSYEAEAIALQIGIKRDIGTPVLPETAPSPPAT